MEIDDKEKAKIIESLSADLGLTVESLKGRTSGFGRDILAPFLDLPVDKMTATCAYDFTLLTASMGEWEFAFYWAQRAIPFFSGKELETLKIWEMRCQLELGRASEVIALAGAYGAPKFLEKEFHFLLGEAFLTLGMKEKARQRFEAVAQVDAKYRGVEFQLKSLKKSLS